MWTRGRYQYGERMKLGSTFSLSFLLMLQMRSIKRHHILFSKKLREQNMTNRSHYKTPHTLGKKSIARKAKEINRTTTTSSETEAIALRNRVRKLEEKLVEMKDLKDQVDKMNDIIYELASSRNYTCRRE